MHRIGRTGRAGESGTAYSLITKKDLMMAPELVKLLNQAGQKVPDGLARLAEVADKTVGGQ